MWAWLKPLGAAAAVALVTVLLLMPLPGGGHGWRSKLFDLGHVPLFGALTLCLWLTLGPSWRQPVLVALTLGALTELLQDAFGRTGDLLDFIRDALGVACAVVLVRAWQGPWTPLRLAGHALALAALLAWPLADAGPRLLDAFEGYRDFPTLADFATERQLLRWECAQADLQRVPAPEGGPGWSGRLTMLPGPREFPGAYLEPLRRDWRGWRRLCCSFTVHDEPLLLVFSFRGHDRKGTYTHHQFEKRYAVGEHTVCAELEEVARRARPTPLDLSDVEHLQLFIYRPRRADTISLHRIWLE
jgi:hypothetical protein